MYEQLKTNKARLYAYVLGIVAVMATVVWKLIVQ